MEPALDDFEREARVVSHHPARICFISNVTGEPTGTCDAAYWRRHARSPVRFADGIAALRRQGYEVFVEVGPNPVLLDLARIGDPDDACAWVPSLRRGKEDAPSILSGLGALFVRGAAVDGPHSSPIGAIAAAHVSVQRQRFWVDRRSRQHDGSAIVRSPHPLIGVRSHVGRASFESSRSARCRGSRSSCVRCRDRPCATFRIALSAGARFLGTAIAVSDVTFRHRSSSATSTNAPSASS